MALRQLRGSPSYVLWSPVWDPSGCSTIPRTKSLWAQENSSGFILETMWRSMQAINVQKKKLSYTLKPNKCSVQTYVQISWNIVVPSCFTYPVRTMCISIWEHSMACDRRSSCSLSGGSRGKTIDLGGRFDVRCDETARYHRDSND